jgi:hypothetical protein
MSTKPKTSKAQSPRRRKSSTPATKMRAAHKAAAPQAKAARKRTPAEGQTKQSRLINLMSSANGATIADLAKATGWQPHSVRGVISGVLRKKLNLKVENAAVDGVRRYRIAA